MKINKIGISPIFKGALTFADLLTSEGTMQLGLSNDNSSGVFFEINTDIFKFILLRTNNSLILKRNNFECALSFEEIFKNSSNVMVYICWSLSELEIDFRNDYDRITSKIKTVPTLPPNDLLNYIKKENLIPNTTFDNEEEFRNKIYSCFLTINEKINKTDSYKSFWDIEYDGHKILNRKPKIETDIQPLIHALIYDQMFLNGIEVIHEYKTGSGSLDFLFIGFIKEKGSCKLCAEFKLAHSADLENGLTQQLPAYMISAGSNYGAYCVLNFKSKWFEKPDFKNEMPLDINLASMRNIVQKVLPDNVRIFIFELGKINTASK